MILTPLFAADPSWAVSWLTPLWLLGVGTFAGLVVLSVLWLVLRVIAMLPGMTALETQPAARWAAIVVVAVVILGGIWGSGIVSRDADVGLAPWVLGWAAASLIAGYAFVTLSLPSNAGEIPLSVREGVLWPILICFAAVATLSVTALIVVPNPTTLLSSLLRLPYVGERVLKFEVPVASEPEGEFAEPEAFPIDTPFRRLELRQLRFDSSEPLTITVSPEEEAVLGPNVAQVATGEQFIWDHSRKKYSIFSEDYVKQLFVRNRGTAPAQLTVTLDTLPAFPEVRIVLYGAAFVVLVFGAYLLQRATMPKASAVALATFKSEVAQPLFMILLTIGVFAVIIFNWIPYNTFGEDIKILKDSGLTLITVLCIIQAVWAASTSISEEIEGRTALTVLSKPIRRRSFILGKFFGITWTVVLLFIVMGFVFLFVVAYKPIYDARETSQLQPDWQICFMEMSSTIPGLMLAFMETVVLAALSVAISTRMPLLANITVCFSVYVLGHLTPAIVQSSAEGFAIVKFVGQLIATVFPNLEQFSVQAALAAGVRVPVEYLALSFVYCVIYTVIAMLLALFMFEDRDLA